MLSLREIVNSALSYRIQITHYVDLEKDVYSAQRRSDRQQHGLLVGTTLAMTTSLANTENSN